MLTFIKNEGDDFQQEYTKAMVTIAIGGDYLEIWSVLCRESWEKFGKQFGYDIIVIMGSLDASARAQSRSPAWQKLLVLKQSWANKYSRIVWMDADIIISSSAIDIVSCFPNKDDVGICTNQMQISPAQEHFYWEKILKTETDPVHMKNFLDLKRKDDFELFGIIDDQAPEYNTGVIVLSPEAHADLLFDVYGKYDQTGPRYEQLPLSHTLFRSGKVKPLSARFNWSVHYAMMLSHLTKIDFDEFMAFLRNELKKSYFLHFAGSMPLLRMLADWRKQQNIVL